MKSSLKGERGRGRGGQGFLSLQEREVCQNCRRKVGRRPLFRSCAPLKKMEVSLRNHRTWDHVLAPACRVLLRPILFGAFKWGARKKNGGVSEGEDSRQSINLDGRQERERRKGRGGKKRKEGRSRLAQESSRVPSGIALWLTTDIPATQEREREFLQHVALRTRLILTRLPVLHLKGVKYLSPMCKNMVLNE